jgi:CRP-like cAMP-binding protein
MKTLHELLDQSPVFAGLAPAQLELIAGCGQNTAFEPGEYVFREGGPAETFYVVRQGRVTLETFVPSRGAVAIQTIDEGDVLGWSWLFSPYRWHFDARALDPIRAIAFDGACLRGKVEADHELGYELLRRFSAIVLRRLQATRLQLMDVYGSAA